VKLIIVRMASLKMYAFWPYQSLTLNYLEEQKFTENKVLRMKYISFISEIFVEIFFVPINIKRLKLELRTKTHTRILVKSPLSSSVYNKNWI
jgi:hypothetical protein